MGVTVEMGYAQRKEDRQRRTGKADYCSSWVFEFESDGSIFLGMESTDNETGAAENQAVRRKQPTPRKALAWRAEQAEEALTHFFEKSLDLQCVAGLDGYFKRLNSAWTTHLGWTREELTDKPFIALVHPDDREATLAVFDNLAAEVPTILFENRYRHRDGSGRALALFFYDGPISRSVAFEGALATSQALVGRLRQAPGGEGRLIHIATDGESYGHHTRLGDLGLAYARGVVYEVALCVEERVQLGS